MQIKRKSLAFMLVSMCMLIFSVLAVGCSGNSASQETQSSPDKGTSSPNPSASTPQVSTSTPAKFPTNPVTLTFYYRFGEDGFNKEFKQPIESKFPNIKLQFVDKLNDEDISQGIVPDIMVLDNSGFITKTLIEKKLQFDLGPFIKKYNVDLSKIQPNIMKDIQIQGDGKIYAFPNIMVPYVLHYNKDIFDKLGVPYPKDGMTWEETIDLAKTLTRNEGGVQYRGLDFDVPTVLLGQLGLKAPDKQEPTFTTINFDRYTRFLEIVKSILEIPGNYPDDPGGRSKMMNMWGDAFFNKKNVAMYPMWNLMNLAAENQAKGAGFNWDVVTFPQLKENPGVAPESPGQVAAISPVSKNQDSAFQVLSYLISEEYQKMVSTNGWGVTVLTNKDIQQSYGSSIPGLKDKNISALFKYPPAAPAEPVGGKLINTHEYDTVWNGIYEFARLEKDSNTILREWQEKAAKAMADDAAK